MTESINCLIKYHKMAGTKN